MTVKLLLAFIGSFVVTVAVGSFLVPMLRRIKAGQSIKSNGPTWHLSKQGTPTMGGLMFICGIFFACFVFGFKEMQSGDWRHIIILAFSLVFAAIGFLDDYQKLKKKENTGLTTIQKFALQLAASVLLIILLRYLGYLSSEIYVPFINVSFRMPDVLYFIFAAFIIIGGVNAVNITDGIDGLVSGVSIPVAVCFTVIVAMWGYTSTGVFSAALAGGLAAFLIFNFQPAKVFMGDTGSLFLGGAVCALAFSIDAPLILIPLGIIYIIETMSDIIQVAYFKATHGKRIFKMAPIHHHLEMCGWSERKIFTVFTTISAIFAVIAFVSVMFRYSI